MVYGSIWPRIWIGEIIPYYLILILIVTNFRFFYLPSQPILSPFFFNTCIPFDVPFSALLSVIISYLHVIGEYCSFLLSFVYVRISMSGLIVAMLPLISLIFFFSFSNLFLSFFRQPRPLTFKVAIFIIYKDWDFLSLPCRRKL